MKKRKTEEKQFDYFLLPGILIDIKEVEFFV